MIRLERAGAQLRLAEGKIRVRAPAGVLDDEFSREIQAYRDEIVRRISGKVKPGGRISALNIVERPDLLPLSYSQQRLWLLDQLQPGSAAYNMAGAFLVEGALGGEALEASLGEVVRRHEALRTRFETVEGQGVQVIDLPGGFRLELSDLSGLAASEREAQARRLLLEEASRPFDLTAGPLFRAKLLRLEAERHLLLVAMHHIVSDGWSIGVLAQEVTALYAAYSQGQPSPLPELTVQYADYALWQRRWLQGEALERQVDYWRGQLAGAPAVLELPTDRPRPPVASHQGAELGFRLSAELSTRLGDLARGEGATLFMVLLAGFQAVLSRWSGQKDIVVGSPTAGRTHRQTEGLIGFFVNTLALRTDLSGNPTFSQLVARVRKAALGAYAHQDLPFERLVAALAPARDLSRQPLFQVMFILQNAGPMTLKLPGLKMSPVAPERITAKFDLTLSMSETAEGLQGTLEYSTDLFEASTVRRLAEHLERVLEQAAEDPRRPIRSMMGTLTVPGIQLEISNWSPPTAESIEAWLVREIAGRLGCSSEEIDVRKPFESHGLDSVEAVGMSGALENWLGVRLPATLAWDFPTIESLARHLSEARF